MSLTPKPKSQKRDAPPISFSQPSPGTSHVSLPEILTPGAAIPGPQLTWGHSNVDLGAPARSVAAVSTKQKQRQPRTLRPAGSARSTDRTDALWAEMQATLEEVELSASEGTRVFGPEHDRKLCDLRAAQIALAQAWARSEADDAIETGFRNQAASTIEEEVQNLKNPTSDPPRPGAGDGTDAGKSTAGGTASGYPQSSSLEADRLGAKLEEETEVDILLARKRREANDEYFRRVNNGVLDVVAKLESVAVAMRTVEQETKDLWNDDSSVPEGSRR
ncbi:hypothetical protein ESCO_003718 [Escovopsis weberi]|uniref:Uncharacterized protein n=1 Tax=Escovopsis weberi TaxID=150374 RepID=A0A0M9VX07_ESCWE|nr:hypothetical protein ESCO_003718 [Escovopsis weberi]